MKTNIIFTAELKDFILIPKLKRIHKGRFSPAAKKYHANQTAMAWEFKKASRYKVPLNCPVKITCSIYLKDKRRKDIDNLSGAILDALVKGDVIEDDSTEIVSQLNVKVHHGDEAKIKVSLMRL